MKKLLSIIMVAMMATSAFAFVPLSNEQNNIGSYQRGATRGMFYNELDIVSAAPVELLDFSGNALYTNWGNIRNFNDIANYGTALDWTTANQWRNDTDVSYFTFGVTGNPLSYAGIEDSRSGIVYQNYGAKTVNPAFDLDNDGTAGDDSEGKWTDDKYTVVYPTLTVNDQTDRQTSDTKYYTNTTNTQWNIGSSYKLMDNVSLGLSLSRQTDTNILTAEGTKTFSERYLTPTGADDDGRPVTATERRSYNFAYPTQEIDQNSTATTDILPQARVKISDDLHVDVGVGLRSAKTLNPNTLVTDEKTIVTVTAREDVLFSTGAGAAANSGQYFNTGTAIVAKSVADGGPMALDYGEVTNIGPNAGLNSNVFSSNRVGLATTDDSGISAFADDRDGIAPLVRIEAVKKFEKVDVTGIVNYSNLSQDIDATQTDREYLQTSCVISTWIAGGNRVSNGSITDNFVAKDYTNIETFKGKGTTSNFDAGAKISMKALEGVKLSFGGFIRKTSNKQDVDTTGKSTELTSYSDGRASTMAYNNGTIVTVGGVQITSSGTFVDPSANPTNPIVDRPGPIAGTDQNVSRGTIETSGEGEGSWLQTISDTGNRVTETVTLSYSVPVGIEIPLSKKWTFRAGTEYVMTKTETTTERTTNQKTQTTVATPVLGETAQASTTETDLTGPEYTKSIVRTEDHDVFYTYGVQFDATPSLTIACNAFLDTAGAGTFSNASIFDLATYRTLSLSAAIKF